jgi:hypothetical protein
MQGHDDEGVTKDRREPNYAKRTISRWAPEFANHEQDVIRQCFSTGSYTSLKQATPNDLAPDSVNALRRQRMNKNRLAEPEPRSKMTQHWGSGHHKDFEYMPDPFDRRVSFDKELRQHSIEKREKVANHDWRNASQEKRMKHEAMIHNPRQKETYPYMGGDRDDDDDLQRSSATSSRTMGPRSVGSENTEATGSFLAGIGRGLEDDSRTSRMMLPTIVQRLQKRITADWEGTAVVVSATDQDLLQVAFHLESVDCERGVLAYMGVFSKDVELGNLGLRKVSQLWGMSRTFAEGLDSSELESTWIFFLLCPKWVRMRPTDAYYTVRPRHEGSTFRMSSAGNSVMLSLNSSSTSDPVETVRRSRRGSITTRGSPSPGYRETLEMAFAAASTPRKRGTEIDMHLIERAITTLPSVRSPRG